MSIPKQTKPTRIEEGDYIDDDQVAPYDVQENNRRYKRVTPPADSHGNIKAYVIKDTETGKHHRVSRDESFCHPPYRVSATDIGAYAPDGRDYLAEAIRDTWVEFVDFDILTDCIRMTVHGGEAGWPDEWATESWDVELTFEPPEE